jgi:ribosomal protein S18 acetylase RimI-like enzyme
MDDVTIRQATTKDAAELAHLRVALTLEYNPSVEPAWADAYDRRCHEFFSQAVAEGSVLAWLAWNAGSAVGAASLELRPTFPRLNRFHAMDARVRSVFVRREYRRRGIARALTEACIVAAREHGVDRLTLGATESGVLLYRTLGFERREREMIYAWPDRADA